MTNNTPTQDLFSSTALVLEKTLPCRCYLPDQPAVQLSDALVQKNVDVLRAIVVLDAFFHAETGEEGTSTPEMMRMELKMNLLVDMVGELISHHSNIPEMMPVRLSTTAISWTAAQQVTAEEGLCVELYLEPKYPRAICLLVDVLHCERVGDYYRVDAVHRGLDEMAIEFLEKIIFRQHRRQVAIEKRSATK